jgi:hypothetical protein
MSKWSSNSNYPEHVLPFGIFEAKILQWKAALELPLEHGTPAMENCTSPIAWTCHTCIRNHNGFSCNKLMLRATYYYSKYTSLYNDSQVAQSVSWLCCRLGDNWTNVQFLAGEKIFLLATPSRLALGPTQPPNQWVSGILCPRSKQPGHDTKCSPPSSA